MAERARLTDDGPRPDSEQRQEPEAAVPVAPLAALARARDIGVPRGQGSRLVALATRAQATAGNRAVARALTGGESRRTLARRLIATGDIDRFRAIAEPASGLQLAHDAATNQITAIGSLVDPPTSPAFASQLNTIMDHPTQDAEAQFGAAQSAPLPGGGTGGVLVGAFPFPDDMSTTQVQIIDLDDVENIEVGAPGHGLAFLAHELAENFEAHAHLPAPAGSHLFGGAHQAGIAAENAVLADVVGPGGRVADRLSLGATPNTLVFIADYEFYFLVTDVNQAPNDNQVSGAREAARVVVGTHTIDGYTTGRDTMPATGAAAVAAAKAELVAHTQSTAVIEGFTDDVGTATVNEPLSQRRADAVRALLTPAGDPLGGATHTHGRGATGFVAGNTTEAERARNRRVVIRIEEPAPP
jgi:outer membrane protein OmpA-like peptidoglycan-associated protein